MELWRDPGSSAAVLWVLAAAKVHLNDHALAVLDLCNGSRDLDRVVVDALRRPPGTMRADDVRQFLAAAQSRGWIVEE